LGEDAAARYVERLGWQVLARNHRTREGEIDIVARDGGALVFIEVRTRASESFGTPEESLTAAKSRRMAACAYAYLSSAPQPPGDWRIDFVAIQVSHGRVTRLDHYKHALQ
jgi:putative endonuclease